MYFNALDFKHESVTKQRVNAYNRALDTGVRGHHDLADFKQRYMSLHCTTVIGVDAPTNKVVPTYTTACSPLSSWQVLITCDCRAGYGLMQCEHILAHQAIAGDIDLATR